MEALIGDSECAYLFVYLGMCAECVGGGGMTADGIRYGACVYLCIYVSVCLSLYV